MQRALIVGGSGMLAGVTTGLATEYGMTVGVIARGQKGLERLTLASDAGPGRVVPMALDYHDIGRLRHWVAHFQLMEGPLDLVVAWIHQPESLVLEAIVEEIEAYRHMPWQFVQVSGSGRGVESLPRPALGAWGRYQRVVLGFVVEAGRSRWLTHPEICQGVLDAIVGGQPLSVVGVLEPWGQRP